MNDQYAWQAGQLWSGDQLNGKTTRRMTKSGLCPTLTTRSDTTRHGSWERPRRSVCVRLPK